MAIAAAQIVGWIRRHDQLGGISALAVYLVVAGGAWLVVSIHLPHRDVRWTALIPGALLVGVGLLAVNVFNVYVTTRLVEDRANTYGALGIAAALLLWLVLVGRVIVVSAELQRSTRRPSGQRGDRRLVEERFNAIWYVERSLGSYRLGPATPVGLSSELEALLQLEHTGVDRIGFALQSFAAPCSTSLGRPA